MHIEHADYPYIQAPGTGLLSVDPPTGIRLVTIFVKIPALQRSKFKNISNLNSNHQTSTTSQILKIPISVIREISGSSSLFDLCILAVPSRISGQVLLDPFVSIPALQRSKFKNFPNPLIHIPKLL
ncbi:hypothetical protein [Belliella pelovolcani]|uniref:hypothetical protein n=1 Tax=Belliella pelovolcani TaxID=529505 RepID=UPI003919F22F